MTIRIPKYETLEKIETMKTEGMIEDKDFKTHGDIFKVTEEMIGIIFQDEEDIGKDAIGIYYNGILGW